MAYFLRLHSGLGNDLWKASGIGIYLTCVHGNCILVQGALRKTVAAFVYVFPEMRDTIWAFLEQYDLPVVVGSPVGKSDQPSQVSAWL